MEMKRILIPSDAPQRGALEQMLRREGWTPMPYGSSDEAEDALTGSPAAAVVLRNSTGEHAEMELVKKVRRLAPDAFLLSMGKPQSDETPDATLREECTPQEIAAAVHVGAAMKAVRATERQLREQLRLIEEQTRTQAERIRELETTCTSLQAWARTAQEMAVRDELTGLYNRRYFLQAAESEIERARRDSSRFAMAMVDIDYFKHYNDTFGHVAGDEILRQFGRVLESRLRRMDTVARYGGEEFIMLLPETRENPASDFAPGRLIERLRLAIERDPALNGSNRSNAPVTISAGVVQYPLDGKTVGDLILEADSRLFRAKEAGRNCVCATGEHEPMRANG